MRSGRGNDEDKTWSWVLALYLGTVVDRRDHTVEVSTLTCSAQRSPRFATNLGYSLLSSQCRNIQRWVLWRFSKEPETQVCYEWLSSFTPDLMIRKLHSLEASLDLTKSVSLITVLGKIINSNVDAFANATWTIVDM